jgi:acyl carrier protein
VEPDRAVDQVRAWLLSRSGGELRDIDLDFDLIDSRLIKSLDFLMFVNFLFDLTGVEMELSDVDVNSFRTLRAIREHFLMPAPDLQA